MRVSRTSLFVHTCMFLLTCAKTCCISIPVASDLFGKKYHPSMTKKTRRADFPKWQRIIFIKCRRACWQTVGGTWIGFLASRSPRFPMFLFVCLFVLMWLLLTLFWLAHANPGRLGHRVDNSIQPSVFIRSSAPSCRQLPQPLWSKCWQLPSFSFYRWGSRGTKKWSDIIMVASCILGKAGTSSHGLGAPQLALWHSLCFGRG